MGNRASGEYANLRLQSRRSANLQLDVAEPFAEVAAATRLLLAIDETKSNDAILLRERVTLESRTFESESAFGIGAPLFGLISLALAEYVVGVAVLLLGCLLLDDSFRRSDVVWIIKNGEVFIEQQRRWSRRTASTSSNSG